MQWNWLSRTIGKSGYSQETPALEKVPLPKCVEKSNYLQEVADQKKYLFPRSSY